jgi:hypothetical protein
MKKRIYLYEKNIIFDDIDEIVIDSVLYKKDEKYLYSFIKRNTHKISFIKTSEYVYKFKNKKLHCLDGPAIQSITNDNKFKEIDRYYIDGEIYFALEYFKHEKRLQYIKRKERKQKFKNIII